MGESAPGLLGGGSAAFGQPTIHGREVGTGARFDHVGRSGATGDRLAFRLEAHPQANFPNGIFALGYGPNLVLGQMSLETCNLVDRFHDRIHRPISSSDGEVVLLGAPKGDFRHRLFSRPHMDVEGEEGVRFPGILDVGTDQRDEVIIVDEFLSIPDLLALGADGVEFGRAKSVAQMFQAGGDGGTAAMFRQRQFGFSPADGLGIDDLVRFPFFQNAILVNARAVGEGVQADDGFVPGNRKATGT